MADETPRNDGTPGRGPLEGAEGADGPGDARDPSVDVPDSAGEAYARTEGPEDADTGRRSGRGTALATSLALLAVVGLGALAAGAYVAWQHLEVVQQEQAAQSGSIGAAVQDMRDEVRSLAARVEANSAALAAQTGGDEDLIEAMRQEVRRELHEVGQSLAAAGDELREETRGALEEMRTALADMQATREDMRVALRRAAAPATEPVDVERLLLIANDALALQRDPDTALEAMRIADARLRALNDPVYAETRRLLASGMAALEQAPRPDIQGMAFTLGGLQQQLSSLPLLGGTVISDRTSNGMPGAAAAQPGPSAWRSILDDVWASLRGLVVIRRTGDDEGPLLAPDQQRFLTQNLYLRLESARLALLAGDSSNYHLSLQTARDWLNQYFEADSSAVARLIERIDALDAADIEPRLPDVSDSLAALRAAMERQRASRAAPPPAAPPSSEPSSPSPSPSTSGPPPQSPSGPGADAGEGQ